MEASAVEPAATVGCIIGAVESPSVPLWKRGKKNQSMVGLGECIESGRDISPAFYFFGGRRGCRYPAFTSIFFGLCMSERGTKSFNTPSFSVASMALASSSLLRVNWRVKVPAWTSM